MTPKAAHEILEQDFFQLAPELDNTFDYVLEYTCYCAIDPQRRAEYADKIAGLLKTEGIYIALVFPLQDAAHPFDSTTGPPFVVNPDELVLMMQARGLELVRREFPSDSIKPRRGREELLLMTRRR